MKKRLGMAHYFFLNHSANCANAIVIPKCYNRYTYLVPSYVLG